MSSDSTLEPSANSAARDEELAEAKKIGRWELFCTLADRALDLAFLAAMAFLFAGPLDEFLKSFAILESPTPRLIAFYLILFSLHVLVSLPLSFFSGHLLQRKFQLTTQSAGAWLRRYAKRTGVALAFNLAMFVGLFWIFWSTGPWWQLVGAAAAFVVMVLVGQLAPVVVMPLFYRIEPLDDPDLNDRMRRLSEGTGLKIEGVYRIALSQETVKANAMLAGMGRTRRVLMGDTLLENFSGDEIEVVFAHEIGHHVKRHLPKMIAAGVVYCGLGFVLCDQFLAWQIGGGYDPFQLPVSALPSLLLALLAFQFAVEPLQNAMSRRFERQCDRYALERTGLATAYVSAFEKLARQNKDDPNPHPLEVALLHDHPPIAERLAMADEFLKA